MTLGRLATKIRFALWRRRNEAVVLTHVKEPP